MNKANALIGYTGFVGQTLSRQQGFDAMLNSKTIDDAAGSSFGSVICAAAPGSMFEANRYPNRDAERTDQLIAQLSRIHADHFTLISSVAVLKDFAAQDEAHCAYEDVLAYGINRRRLEQFVEAHFPRALIMRLPALFGEGLKKNFLFDVGNPAPSMLTADRLNQCKAALGADLSQVIEAVYDWDDALAMFVLSRQRLGGSGRQQDLDAAMTEAGFSAVGFTNPESAFQFYDMQALSADIDRVVAQGIEVIHLAPEPVCAGDVFTAIKGHAMPASAGRVHREDMRSAHAALWGQAGPYIADRAQVLCGIAAYFDRVVQA